MNFADFGTAPNGFPLEADATLGFMQSDYQSAIKGLAGLAGASGVILSGMVDNGVTVTDGWLFYGGDVVKFVGGAKQSTFVISNTIVQKANQNGTLYDRYTTKVAQFGSGSGSISYSTLRRIESIEFLQARILNLINPLNETGVIINGMVVSNVDTPPGECQISAGVALIGSNFVSTSAYTGAYPAYLKDDGTFVTSVPGSGSYITFDPYTSQYYREVIRRANSMVGQLTTVVVSSDLAAFDGTGLGKWQYKGWALCNGSNGTVDLRGRFLVGYDNRNSDPSNGIWDILYNTVGSTGGEKAHVLTEAELPAIGFDATEYGLIRKSEPGENVTVASVDTTGAGVEPDVKTEPLDFPFNGSGTAHENRPPFRVVVYIQRIA